MNVIEKTTKDDPIFESPAFLPDTVAFNLLLLIKDRPSSTIYSNNEDIAIVIDNERNDIWVWTISDLSHEKLMDMWSFVKELINNSSMHGNIYIKSVIAHSIYLDLAESRRMFAYHCTSMQPLTLSHGTMRKAVWDDLPKLSELVHRCTALNVEDSILKVKEYLEHHFPFIWSDLGDMTDAMAVIKGSASGYMRIGGVFTDPECRGMGYEKSLIYKITENILNDGHTPMLYAYDTSAAAHKLYTSIGYIRCGLLSVVKF